MKKILVVIDAQNDFITGSLRNEEAIAAVPALVKKILSFDGCAIFATKDTHSADYLSTPEGAKLPVVHCVKGTEGWNLDPQVQAALDSASARGIPVKYIGVGETTQDLQKFDPNDFVNALFDVDLSENKESAEE